MCSGESGGASVHESVRLMQKSVIVATPRTRRFAKSFSDARFLLREHGYAESFRNALSKERLILDKTARGLRVQRVGAVRLLVTSSSYYYVTNWASVIGQPNPLLVCSLAIYADKRTAIRL